MEDVRKKYEKEGFSKDQIDEIEIGIQKGLKVSHYAKKEFLAIQMHQIRLGLEEKLAVNKYASIEYDWLQMEEIRKGLKSGVDVSKFAYPKMSYEVMRQIRKGLEQGIELPYRNGWSAGVLRELRRALLAKVNIIKYIREGYKEEQLREIRKAIEGGIDIDPYISIGYNGACIHEIVEGLESKLDVSIYVKEEYNWQQMREIRLGLKDRVDINYYTNVLYNWQQMREIRLGLEEGLAVDSYATLMYTEREMVKKRNELSASYVQMASEKNEYIEQTLDSKEELDFSINISKDEMEAIIVFHTNNRKMDKENLFTNLFKAGITHGIEESAVNLILKGTSPQEYLVIARGTKPEQGTDGSYEFFFRTNLSKKPVILEDGSVDYKNIDWMESVKKNQKIAYYHEAQEGTDGKTVTGKVIPARKGKELKMLSGKGFELLTDRKTYISAKDGKIEYVNDKIMITDMLELDDVTTTTGNIQFDGSVHIRGNIGRGVSINSTKDIIVDGFVEAADLSAQGDIILKKGCNASGGGSINAGKDLMARFLEGARIHTQGSVKINYCMNCDIYAEEKIEVTGMIAGGVSYAAGGIKAADIGNISGIRTIIRVGEDEEFLKREALLNGKICEVEEELQMLRRATEDFQRKYPVEIRNTNPVYLKLEDAVYTKKMGLEKLTNAKDSMNQYKEKFKDADIEVTRSIYEGSYIEISGATWRAKNVNRVTLRKEGSRVAIISQ